jgi:hypothetical protein
MQPKILKISTSAATQLPRFWSDVPNSNHRKPVILARAQNTRDFEKSTDLQRGAVAERPTNTLSHVVPGPPKHLNNLRDSTQLHVAVDVDEGIIIAPAVVCSSTHLSSKFSNLTHLPPLLQFWADSSTASTNSVRKNTA